MQQGTLQDEQCAIYGTQGSAHGLNLHFCSNVFLELDGLISVDYEITHTVIYIIPATLHKLTPFTAVLMGELYVTYTTDI